MHTKYLSLLILLLLTYNTFCFSQSNEAKLTIVFVIDGFNNDNIDKLKPFLEKGTLRQLAQEATRFNISFPYNITGGLDALTTILTGNTPDIHTINNETHFDVEHYKTFPMLFDKETPGIGTNDKLSPKNIRSATFTDLTKIKFGKQSKIYAVGIHPQTTITMAGHAANTCFWLDSASKQWATTTFFPIGLPSIADKMNIDNFITEKLKKNWFQQMDINAYMTPTKKEQKNNFLYKCYEHIYNTPVTNDLILESALQLQKYYKLGKDHIPDILLLELTTISPKAKSDIIQSAEQEDMYLRLNLSLNNFLQKINARIGAGNYNIVLLGIPHFGLGKHIIENTKLKYTKFDIDKVTALTSSYLIALYGNKKWISGGFGNTIFLNKKIIEQNNLNFYTIAQQVADFLLNFEGIQIALPLNNAICNQNLQKIINKHNFGDIVFELEPFCQQFIDEKTIYDFIIEPQPNATMWLWNNPNNSNSKTQNIDATQCLQIFLNLPKYF